MLYVVECACIGFRHTSGSPYASVACGMNDRNGEGFTAPRGGAGAVKPVSHGNLREAGKKGR